ncbi:RagB/SusD family nutrient uptake outer membrane protein [Prolixibacteraceae bacterium]|nr:RagB/SusD family nutrient uptake outer membrane protein [Prolixibacteraceae bacterium]
MKQNIIVAALAVLSLGTCFQSCDFLEEDRSVIVESDTYFRTIKELELAVTPIYNYLFKDDNRLGGLNGRGFSLNCGDPALTAVRGLNKQRMIEFDDLAVSDRNADIEAVWKSLYRAIGVANNIIGATDRILQLPGEDLDYANALLAEVHFMRAYAYYNVVSYWGQGPIVKELLRGEQAQLTRISSAQDIYKLILEDLAIAKKLPAKQTDIARPTADAVKMLEAYVYMNMAGYPLNLGQEYYQKAADLAAEVVNSGLYTLYDNYSDLWNYGRRLDRGKEHIFSFFGNFTANRSQGVYGGKALRGTEEGGWRDYVVETDFYNNFPNDSRRDASIYSVIKYDKKGKLLPEAKWKSCLDGKEKHMWVGKYRDLGGAPWKDVGSNGLFSVFRLADALLLLAEADNLANGGPTPRAYEALRLIQHRAYDGTPAAANIIADGVDQTTFDEIVLAERNWEFAFENKTWITMVRRQLIKKFNKDHASESDGFDPNAINEEEVSFFPIPAHETLINPNLK